jgi:uncharacterized damage-inducible protein DinB
MKTLLAGSVAVLALFTLPASAQDAKAAPAPAAVKPTANPATTGLSMPWARVKDISVRAAEKMPEADYAFRPVADVRTFGQLVGHMADSNVMMCSLALGEKADPGTVEKTLTAKADLVAALKASIALCDRAFAQGDGPLAAPINLFGFDTNRFALVGILIGHEFEHYGNMVTYMRMKGIVPPSSEPPPAAPPAAK